MVFIFIIILISGLNISNWAFQLYRRDSKYSDIAVALGAYSFLILLVVEGLLFLGYTDYEVKRKAVEYNVLSTIIVVVITVVKYTICWNNGTIRYNKICNRILRLKIEKSAVEEKIGELKQERVVSIHENALCTADYSKRNKLIESYLEEYNDIQEKIDSLEIEKIESEVTQNG